MKLFFDLKQTSISQQLQSELSEVKILQNEAQIIGRSICIWILYWL